MEPTTTERPLSDQLANLIEQLNPNRETPTYAGLHMTELGEDGETVIAPGHVELEAFVAALREYDAAVYGAGYYKLADYDGTADGVEHVMVALVPWCPYAGDDPADRPHFHEDREAHPDGCDCEGPGVWWGKADPPGWRGDPPERTAATILGRG